MAFDLSAVSAFVNETDNLNDIFRRSMYGNDSAPWLTQITGVKATNALPTINHEQDVLVSAAAELTAANFNGDVVVDQVDLITSKVAYWNKFNLAQLEGYFTQKYLLPGANYDLGQTESVLAAMLSDSIPNVISKQVENLTWKGDTTLTGDPLVFTNGFNKLTNALTPTSTGAITASNARTYIDGLVDAAMADGDWAADITAVGRVYIMCGHDVVRKYSQQYRADFTAAPYNTEFNKFMVDGTNVMLIPCAGLTGTNVMYLVKNDVFVQGSDLLTDQASIMMGMDQFEEYVWVKAKFRIGFAARDVNAKSILVHRATSGS